MQHTSLAFRLAVGSAVVLALFTAGHGNTQEPAFLIITNQANNIDMMSPDVISDIFMKKTTRWSNGSSAIPVDLQPDSPIRGAFSEHIHQKNTARIRSFWQKQIFTGGSTPPVEFPGDAEVIDFVASNPGAIGYVSASAPIDRVKVVNLVNPPVVLKKVPPEYPITAQRIRIQGDVVLRLLISPSGAIDDVQVVQGLKHGLTEAAVNAVQSWRFKPATSGNKPVQANLDVTVAFRL